MSSALETYRLFDPSAIRPASAEGLDLTGFHAAHPDRRAGGPFRGTASRSVNAGEAFFADARAFLKDGRLRLADPFGSGDLTTRDVVAGPSTPWPSVPLYLARFPAAEPVVLVKRGLSWCTDLGVVFPRRRLFVSWQVEDRRMAQDVADLAHVEQWFASQKLAAFEPATPQSDGPPCLVVTSGHFAHHVWNELSVIDGFIEAGIHKDLRILVNEAPVAPLTAIFPELAPAQVEPVSGAPHDAMRLARERGCPMVPAGRRYVSSTLAERLRNASRALHPEAAMAAQAFRASHGLVLWFTLRCEARTATNLVEALATLTSALRAEHDSVGVIVDGFTTPAGVGVDWNRELIARERTALSALRTTWRDRDYVSVIGRPTTEAFLWAGVADYYVTPYGSAQHKVAWLNPIPGTVHAGENKRPVAFTDAGPYARQAGSAPEFFFSPVTQRDAAADHRHDLLSYEIDVPSFVRHVMDDIRTRAQQRRSQV